MRAIRLIPAVIFAASFWSATSLAAPPQYNIFDIGVLSGDTTSQGQGVSGNGIATGRSNRSGQNRAFYWTESGGLIGLPNITSPARSFCYGNGVNDAGVVVGTGATTFFGSSRIPLIWQNGVVSQLPLPIGQTLGEAWDINNNNVAVGSVSSGSTQRGAIYSGGSAAVITQTTPLGCYDVVAYGVNDSGRVVGIGWDPANAVRNVGYVLDTATNTAFEVGGLPGMNGAIAFAVSNAGHVVGSSMLNQGSGLPFIWSDANGIQPIPLPVGTTQGSARGVNSSGWAVGTASSAYAIPFLYDGTASYRLADLIPAGTGWDLSTNTSSSALGISETGMIVGTGVYNGAVHAYAMIPVPEPTTLVALALAAATLLRRRA
jgi:hypothetical protein